jgi:glycosyltransferase involved in cell wall biosynthesis
MVKFSVIIPALNEEAYIAHAIQSLQTQTIPRDQYEIVVVDNNSDDRTSEIALKAGADSVVVEKNPGTNLARQRGVIESRGEIVVFLDADCVAPPLWLADIERLFQKNSYVVVSGPYVYDFKGMMRFVDWVYTHLFMPVVPKLLRVLFWRKAGIIQEGNFAIKRWALEKIGGLPPLPFYGDGAATAMLISRRVGKMLFTSRLTVKSSSRRLQKTGVSKQTIRYAIAYLKMYFSKEYR